MTSPWSDAVDAVVRAELCNGCGACALIDPGVRMQLNTEGNLRPVTADVSGWTAEQEAEKVRLFRTVCSGLSVTMPLRTGRRLHPVFGPYVSSHLGWAEDAEIRERGSSGGVLTALTAWLIETGQGASARAVTGAPDRPTRSVPVRIMSRGEALSAAGSRYAPVSSLAGDDDSSQLGPAAVSDAVHVGRPCESDGFGRWLQASRVASGADGPVRLSFFCAGLPSQHATDELTVSLGAPPADVASLHYRGSGWPGRFSVTTHHGERVGVDYETSWGQHLGRAVQDRCKVCPDGTGMHADIVVGDFWNTDDRGYPVFTEGKGQSVVIARTGRGHQVLMNAEAAGVVRLQDIDLDRVADVQPLQVHRLHTLSGRLLGRASLGRRIPRLHGYRLWESFLRHPVLMLRVARGTRARLRGKRVRK